MMDRFCVSLAGNALQHRTPTLGLWALVLIACMLGALNLKFSNDYRVFFDEANPELRAHNRVENRFSQTDSVNFILHTEEGDLFTANALETIDWLTDRVLDIPYASRAQAVANYQYSYAEGDDLIVEPLFEQARRSKFEDADARKRIRALSQSEAAVNGRLVSSDGKTAQIMAVMDLPDDGENVLPQIAADVEKIRADLAIRAPELSVATTGVVLLSQSFFEITISDMMVLFPLMIAVLAILLTWFLRAWQATILCLALVFISIGAAMGIAGWLGIELTPATGQAPILIMTIAVADSVHLLATYRARRFAGASIDDAILQAVQKNARPVLLTSLTTILGFLTLNFSDTPPFRDLGNIAAIGTGLACILSLHLLPLFIKMLPGDGDKTAMQFDLSRIVHWVKPMAKPILLISFLLSLAAAYGMSTLEVRDKFVEWIGPGHIFRKDADFVQEKMPALFTMQFSVDARPGGSVTTPEYLKDLEQFADYMRGQNEVAHVFSFDTIIRRLNRNLNNDDPEFDRLPDSPQAGAQYLLLYEMSLPFGEDLTTILDVGRTGSRMVVTLNNVSSREMQELRSRAFTWAQQNVFHITVSDGAGTNMIFAELTRSNTKSMLYGSILVASLIALVLMLALRDIRLGLLSLLPNALPPLFAFGVWAVLVGSVGLYAAFVVATALGMIVDATVHFLDKYRAHRASEMADPIAATVGDVGAPVIISGLALIGGFAVLSFSNFAIIALLAQVVSITLVFALLTDFILLPALLYVLDRR